MSLKIDIKPFDKLTAVDVYHILRARAQVFVVEQHSIYQDPDGLDFDALHVVAHQDLVLVGYCRIIPPDAYADNFAIKPTIDNAIEDTSAPSGKLAIGRVLVLPEHRGSGLAKQLMQKAISYCKKNYKKYPIHIAAQTYLIEFYESLGFERVGEPYTINSIEHIDMILGKNKKAKFNLAVFNRKSGANKVVLILLTLLLVAMAIAILVYFIEPSLFANFIK